MKKLKILLELMLNFMKIGLFTFGGGYAMISIIENNCVEKKQWISHDEMLEVTVIAESTPGPIAINCATFVGFKQAGLPGAFAATLGIVLPSFFLIYAISIFLDNILEIGVISSAFKGIKIAVGILILDAAFTMIKKMPKKSFPRMVMLCSFAAMLSINVFSWQFSSIFILANAAVISLVRFIFYDGPMPKGWTKS